MIVDMGKFSLRCLFSIYRRSVHCQDFVTVRAKAVPFKFFSTRKSLEKEEFELPSFSVT